MSNKLLFTALTSMCYFACTDNDAATYVTVLDECYKARSEYEKCISNNLNTGCPEDMGVDMEPDSSVTTDMQNCDSYGECFVNGILDSGVESEPDAEVQPPSLCELSEVINICEPLRNRLNACLEYCATQSLDMLTNDGSFSSDLGIDVGSESSDMGINSNSEFENQCN